jgi:hypothetical protein
MSSDHKGQPVLLVQLAPLVRRVRKDLLALLVRRVQPEPPVRKDLSALPVPPGFSLSRNG